MNREIEEKALDGILPLLTIQPLLENAVEHGIAPAGGGTITIRCSLNDACMHIEIINTGRETGKEDRERIEAQYCEQTAPDLRGIGRDPRGYGHPRADHGQHRDSPGDSLKGGRRICESGS